MWPEGARRAATVRAVRRSGFIALVLAVTATAACGGGSKNGEAGGGASTTPPTTPSVATTAAGPTTPPTNFTLRVTDVRLVNSEEEDSGMRILLPAGVGSADVTLTGLPTPNQVISVCQANALAKRMEGATCKTPANGQPVTVNLGSAASGVEVVQVGVVGPGPDGNSAALEEVNVRYAASSRELNVRLPQIASGDAGGHPTFSLTPPGADGSYRAKLSWTVIPVFGGSPSSGQLQLVQGGNVTNQAQSGADTTIGGNVPAPVGDAAIRVANVGPSALVSPTLDVLLP